jgi:hypothetical protein
MSGGLIDRIEAGAEHGASGLLAVAAGYSAYALSAATLIEPQLGLCAAGAGALAYLPCSRLLRVAGAPSEPFVLPDFDLADFEFSEPPEELLLTERLVPADELVLTDADRIDGAAPLVLDDILDAIGPEARVVRLFDRMAMPTPGPTPGQLHSRIANHVNDGVPLCAPSDASQALSAALAELRRSLR